MLTCFAVIQDAATAALFLSLSGGQRKRGRAESQLDLPLVSELKRGNVLTCWPNGFGKESFMRGKGDLIGVDWSGISDDAEVLAGMHIGV